MDGATVESRRRQDSLSGHAIMIPFREATFSFSFYDFNRAARPMYHHPPIHVGRAKSKHEARSFSVGFHFPATTRSVIHFTHISSPASSKRTKRKIERISQPVLRALSTQRQLSSFQRMNRTIFTFYSGFLFFIVFSNGFYGRSYCILCILEPSKVCVGVENGGIKRKHFLVLKIM